MRNKTLNSTERVWIKYEKIRRSGKYNMATEAIEAMRESGLLQDEYLTMMNHYKEIESKLVEKIGKEKIEELLTKQERR